MAGKLCPNCKQRTLFVSGENQRTCTKCGYTETIDVFLPLKNCLGVLFLVAVVAFILGQIGIGKYCVFTLPVIVLITIILLIKAIVNHEGVGLAIKRLLLTIISCAVALIIFVLCWD